MIERHSLERHIMPSASLVMSNMQSPAGTSNVPPSDMLRVYATCTFSGRCCSNVEGVQSDANAIGKRKSRDSVRESMSASSLAQGRMRGQSKRTSRIATDLLHGPIVLRYCHWRTPHVCGLRHGIGRGTRARKSNAGTYPLWCIASPEHIAFGIRRRKVAANFASQSMSGVIAVPLHLWCRMEFAE